MIPAVDNKHVAEGVALLTSRFNGKPVITGMVTACMERLQEIEDAFWAMINAVQITNHPMVGGPWDVLDKIGLIVGVSRDGLSDTDYLALIKVQIRVNRGRGNPEDILALGKLLATVQPPTYLESDTAAFYLATLNVQPPTYAQFVRLLKQVRPASVYALLIYTTWAAGNDLILGSDWTSGAGQGGLGSRYDAAVGAKLSASLVM